MKLSLVVAVRGSQKALPERLRHLSDLGIEILFLVVSSEAIQGGPPTVMAVPEQLDLAASYNMAAASTTRPLICFTTDDALPTEAALNAIVTAADEMADCIWTPEAVWLDGPSAAWFKAYCAVRPEPFRWASGANCPTILAVRRDAFLSAGGFDERLGDAAITSNLAQRISASPRILSGWPLGLPPPRTSALARRSLRDDITSLAMLAVRRGQSAPPSSMTGAFSRLEKKTWNHALSRARLSSPQTSAGAKDTKAGVLSVDALAATLNDRAKAPHLKAPSRWPVGSAPRLSVIIPSYRRPGHLAALLPILAPQAREAGAEIVVVDDGSQDETYGQIIAPYADVVTYHRLDQNLGRGGATNAGLARATGDWIVFTDDDVRPPHDWLAELTAVLRRFPDLDAVGGTCRPLGRENRGLVERFTLARANYLPRPYFARGTLKCMITACMAVRADVLAKVGGIDTHFVAGQDHNLTWRLRKAKARIHVTADWWVAHDQAWSLRDLTGRMYGYAYWHVRQAELSGEPIDYLFGPLEDWATLFRCTPKHLRWVMSEEAKSDRPFWLKTCYVALDMASHFAWNLGGIAGVAALRKEKSQA